MSPPVDLLNPIFKVGGELVSIDRDGIDAVPLGHTNVAKLGHVLDRFADDELGQCAAAVAFEFDAGADADRADLCRGRVNHAVQLVIGRPVARGGAFDQVNDARGGFRKLFLSIGRVVLMRWDRPDPVDLRDLEGTSSAHLLIEIDDLQRCRLQWIKLSEEPLA